MRIAIDLLGGDHAPEVALGALEQLLQLHPEWEYLAVGREEELARLPKAKQLLPVACGSMMAMDEDVRNLLRKKDSSIWIATELVKKGEADAIVSAGSTGAQMTAATLLLGRVKGVQRPAIGTVLPTLQGGRLLLDVGANPDCTPELLLQFAQMGTTYAHCVLGIEKPRVALLANGTEDHKGSKLTQAAFALLQESSLNFLGNREGRDLLNGEYDVMVCDGMSGNIALKSLEGAIAALMLMLKEKLSANLLRKLGASLIMPGLRELKKSMDYQEYGGAPLLGVNGVSIICHGSSKERALLRACEVAAQCLESRFVEELGRAVQ
ncbi:MAG: phosphate acyltransferase PlsX [Bacillota bacterium]|nr:phosphate acyltransferase PlsX [Bacillota bacterium]